MILHVEAPLRAFATRLATAILAGPQILAPERPGQSVAASP